jgi:two-component system, LuxR family, response regulator FixJ
MAGDPVVHVIDDDDAARDALGFLLTAANFSIRTYESAMAFLDAVPTTEPGCVITDVRMPEITGLELLRRLEVHRANVMTKMQARSLSHLVRMVLLAAP